jgi:hypothetical protein
MNYNYTASGSVKVSNIQRKKKIHIRLSSTLKLHLAGEAIIEGKYNLLIHTPEKIKETTISCIVDDTKIEVNGFLNKRTYVPAIQINRDPSLRPVKKLVKSPRVVYTKKHPNR